MSDDNKKKSITVEPKEKAEAIEVYLLGKPVEKEYPVIGNKLSIRLRVPSSKLMEVSDRLMYSLGSAIELTVQNNINLLGTMISRYGDKDFAKEQGDDFDTEKGLKERITYLEEVLNVPMKDILIEVCKEFREWFDAVFNREELKNF